MDYNTLDPTVEQLVKTAGGMLKEKLKEWNTRASEAVKARLQQAKSWLMTRLSRFMTWLKAHTKPLIGFGAGMLFTAVVLWSNWRRLKYLIKRLQGKYRCWKLWRRISSGKLAAGACITACQSLNTELLAQAGYHAVPSMDLLEKCALFPAGAEPLRQDYRLVAQAAFDLWYSPHTPNSETVQNVLQATTRFRKNMQNA